MLILESVIGHRGACAYAPENTMASFMKAYELGCRWIEFDVMCSQDGVPFIIHDDTLTRTTNGKGKVGQVSADYLKGLDAGLWFSKSFAKEPIPLLVDLIQWIDAMGMCANVEIKPFSGTERETTQTVLSLLNHYWPANKSGLLISSFSWEVLLYCKSIAPHRPLGFLLHKWDSRWFEKAQQLHCYSVHLNHKILTKERVKQIKNKGYRVCAYTVNKKKRAQQLLSWGVDSIFSDYPDLLKASSA